METSMLKDRLHELLTVFQLKPAQFAKRIGISKTYAAALLKGTSTSPSDSFYNRVACEFHVNMDWLMFGEGSMMEDDKCLSREAAFFMKYLNLPQDNRDFICDILMSFEYKELYKKAMKEIAELKVENERLKEGCNLIDVE